MKQVPKIESLIELYGTPWDVAFFISRQMYNHQIISHYEGKIFQVSSENSRKLRENERKQGLGSENRAIY